MHTSWVRWRGCGYITAVFICSTLLMYTLHPPVAVRLEDDRKGSKKDFTRSGDVLQLQHHSLNKKIPAQRKTVVASLENDTRLSENVLSLISNYVTLTQDKNMESTYKTIVDAHFLKTSQTTMHCSKQKYKSPAPHEFFRVHEDIVNPYTYREILTPDPYFCDESTFAVTITLSYHGNIAERIAIRETWGNSTWLYNHGYIAIPTAIKQLFLFGLHKNETMNDLVRREHASYGDILQGEFEESYKTLGYKSRMALRWISNNCAHARYIIKADDDLVVNIPRLYAELRHRVAGATTNKSFQNGDGESHDRVTMEIQNGEDNGGSSDVDRRAMIGHCNDKEPVHRQPRSKFFSSCNEFPFDRRPVYMDGPLYIITSDMAAELFLIAQHMQDYFIDDAFISGFLTIPLNVTLKCERGYGVNAKEDSPKIEPRLKFAISAKDTNEMREKWDSIKHSINPIQD